LMFLAVAPATLVAVLKLLDVLAQMLHFASAPVMVPVLNALPVSMTVWSFTVSGPTQELLPTPRLVPLPEAANAAVATPTTSDAEMAETTANLRANMRMSSDSIRATTPATWIAARMRCRRVCMTDAKRCCLPGHVTITGYIPVAVPALAQRAAVAVDTRDATSQRQRAGRDS
jgi:hypothetical protein